MSYAKAGEVAGVPAGLGSLYHGWGNRTSMGAGFCAEADGEGDAADPTQVDHPSRVRTQLAQKQINPAPPGPEQVRYRQVGLHRSAASRLALSRLAACRFVPFGYQLKYAVNLGGASTAMS